MRARYADRCRLTAESHLRRDLGLDSIEWLDLALEIGERTGVRLSDAAIARIETIADLLHEVVPAAAPGRTAPAAPSILDEPEAHLDARQKRWIEPVGPLGAPVARGLYELNRAIFRGLFRLRVEGLDRLPNRQAMILTPNHFSFLDPFAVAAALDFARLRRTFWAETATYFFANPVNRRVSERSQAFPVDGDRHPISSFALSAAVLKRGHDLIWFPEGARSRSGGLEAFEPGIGVLLARYPRPVVPVAIHGTYEAWPAHRRLPRPHPVRVVFGDPLEPGALRAPGEGERAWRHTASALRHRVADLHRRTAFNAAA